MQQVSCFSRGLAGAIDREELTMLTLFGGKKKHVLAGQDLVDLAWRFTGFSETYLRRKSKLLLF